LLQVRKHSAAKLLVGQEKVDILFGLEKNTWKKIVNGWSGKGFFMMPEEHC